MFLVLLSWSGGKDSALALQALRSDSSVKVAGLLTTVSGEYRRISHHGVREELLDRQAGAIGLPLDKMYLPAGPGDGPCTNEQYERLIADTLARHQAAGVTHIAHGDLFLADLRAYRERNLAKMGLKGLFPLWGQNTRGLYLRFVAEGFKAYTCCVEGNLGREFVGRLLDETFLRDLPAGIDPCGENGEYHSFVFDGPIFQRTLPTRVGKIVCREGRYYADLLPEDALPDTDPRIPPVGTAT
ncbi:MAG: ATP-binding protein [Pirellulales bacterium]